MTTSAPSLALEAKLAGVNLKRFYNTLLIFENLAPISTMNEGEIRFRYNIPSASQATLL